MVGVWGTAGVLGVEGIIGVRGATPGALEGTYRALEAVETVGIPMKVGTRIGGTIGAQTTGRC